MKKIEDNTLLSSLLITTGDKRLYLIFSEKFAVDWYSVAYFLHLKSAVINSGLR
jgi:hypothetical protein